MIGLLASRYVYKQVQRAGTVKPMQTTQIVIAAERLVWVPPPASSAAFGVVAANNPLPGSFTRMKGVQIGAVITSLVK